MQTARAPEGLWLVPRRGGGDPLLCAPSIPFEARATGFPYSLYSVDGIRLCFVESEAQGRIAVRRWESESLGVR